MLIVILLVAALGIVDRLAMEKKMDEVTNKYSLEKAMLEEKYKKEISRLLEINEKLKAEEAGAIYKKITVKEINKPIERVSAEIRIPYEMHVEEFTKNYPDLISKELWKMMESRAIIEVRDDMVSCSKVARFSWFVNVDGEILNKDSFF